MALIVIVGPPAAGKSTWVRQHAQAGDIVIDYDVLAGALSIPAGDMHTHPPAVRAITFRARSAAIAEALKHVRETDVYIIHSLPSAQAAARYAEHDARVVTVDPGRDVVMARIAEQRPGAMVAVAERWYSQHGDAVQSQQKSSRRW